MFARSKCTKQSRSVTKKKRIELAHIGSVTMRDRLLNVVSKCLKRGPQIIFIQRIHTFQWNKFQSVYYKIESQYLLFICAHLLLLLHLSIIFFELKHVQPKRLSLINGELRRHFENYLIFRWLKNWFFLLAFAWDMSLIILWSWLRSRSQKLLFMSMLLWSNANIFEINKLVFDRLPPNAQYFKHLTCVFDERFALNPSPLLLRREGCLVSG